MAKLDYFVIHGKRVRVEYSDSTFCCIKCAFVRERECPREKCCLFNEEGKFAYFVPAKRRRTWADVAAALVALAVIALLGVIFF